MIHAIQGPIEALAGYAGLPTDPFKIILCLLLSYPMAAVLKRLPDNQPLFKNLFVIATGSFILVGIFDLWGGVRTLFISCSVTWLLSKYYTGPLMPWLNFFFIMGHMSINQIHRQRFGNDDIVDITGAQMVLVMKLTAFAWNIHDGRTARRAQNGISALVDFQRESVLTEMPDLISYIAWALFFPSLLIGPAFEYAQYRAWLNCTIFDVQAPQNTKAAKKMANGRKIPRSGTAAAKRAIEGLFWLACFGYLSPRYTVTEVLSDSFAKTSFLYRVWYIVPLAFTHRSKYYGIWKLSEGACVLAGFGFKGFTKSGAIDWSSIENISPYEFETAQNTKALLEAWNKNTNKWLKHYVYLRVTPKGKKPGFLSTMATFATSAIWHGFYPGYYFAFTLGAFVQTMGKHYRRHFRPFFMTLDADGNGAVQSPTRNKWIYDVVCWIVTQWTWAYIVQAFVVLSFSGSLKFWSRYYFIVHIVLLFNFVFFSSGLSKPLKTRLKKRQALAAKSENTKPVNTEGKEQEEEEELVTMIPVKNEGMEVELNELRVRASQEIDARLQSLTQQIQ